MAPKYVETAGGEWFNQTDDACHNVLCDVHIMLLAHRDNEINVEREGIVDK